MSWMSELSARKDSGELDCPYKETECLAMGSMGICLRKLAEESCPREDAETDHYGDVKDEP
jgi:hypothetical protein